MANTFAEIINTTYNLLNESTTSTTYSLTIVKEKINSVIKQICRREYPNIYTNQIYKAWDLSFLREKEAIKTAPNTYLTKKAQAAWTIVKLDSNGNRETDIDGNILTETVTADTEIYFNTTWFLPSWYLNIWWEIIQYTWLKEDSVTWVTWLDFTQPTSTFVRQVYKLPSDSIKPFDMEYIIKDWQYYNTWMIEYQDFRYNYWYTQYYTVLNDESNNSYIDIIWYPEYSNFILHYYIRPTELVNDSDEIIIPEDYWIRVVAALSAWELFYENEEDIDAQRELNKWYKELNSMFNFYSKIVDRPRWKIQPKYPRFDTINAY